jgi:RNA polymerase sigma-70 factor (ECF subfamily)
VRLIKTYGNSRNSKSFNKSEVDCLLGKMNTAKNLKSMQGRVRTAEEEIVTALSLEVYFNKIYSETIKSLKKFVISKSSRLSDAEDILQNIYAKFFKRIKLKGWADIDNAEAFLINIAKLECRNSFEILKKNNKTSAFAEYSDEQMSMVEADMSKQQEVLEDVLCNGILAREIFDDINNGDPEIGKIFYMHFVMDMKLDKVAEVLDMTVPKVKSKLYRTIERQKKKFGI